MTAYFIFIFPLSHMGMSFVLKGKEGNIKKLLSGKENQRKNLDHVQPLALALLFGSVVDSIWSLM